MGIKTTDRTPLRRIALVLAAIGVLVMSSGAALMAGATPALAAGHSTKCGGDSRTLSGAKVSDGGGDCCGSGGGGDGRVMSGAKTSDDGGGKCCGSGSGGGDGRVVSGAKVSDGGGDCCGGGGGDGRVTSGAKTSDDGGDCGGCGSGSGGGDGPAISGAKTSDDGGGDCDDTATANVTFTDPSCANQNATDYTPTGTDVTFSINSGSVAPGQSVVIRATANAGTEFADESTTMDFPHTFGDALNLEGPPCVVVSPPTVVPTDPSFTDPTCSTDPSYTLPSAAPALRHGRKATGPVLETKDVGGVEYVVTGVLAPGGTVDVDASAIAPNVLADGAVTHFSHTFTTPTGCGTVSPPDVDGTTVIPTLVHAGLVAPDLRNERGLTLIVAGMLLLVAAMGLGLRSATGRTRG